MSYLENLKTEASYTETLNGAKTHGTTGDACLDFFAVAGGMRYRSERDLILLFDKAYIENPDLAMKLLFYIRDIRGGIGERRVFRVLIRHVAKVWPKSAIKNVHLIAEYGRWDDLMCLMATKAEAEVVSVIKAQLDKDMVAATARENGFNTKTVSLLAKWLPSINTSSAKTRGQARVLANALGLTKDEYRKTLSYLRKYTGIVERKLTSHDVDKINYEAVPANAMLKYRNAFLKNDSDRFTAFVNDASVNHGKMHADTLFPYQILRPYFSSKYNWCGSYMYSDKTDTVLNALWNNQPKDVNNQNALCVIDTSGSMYCGCNPHLTPALVSQSLGIYYAERNKGVFHNTFITFSDYPQLLTIKGKTLEDKLRYIAGADWGCSTNLEAVFDLILRTAVNSHASQEEMPEVLYIISDMEFNCCVRNPKKTVYENAKEKFEAHGYHLPAVVFHNVNSWQMQTPVTAHTKGTALSSGASVAAFKEKFDGNITPLDHMLRVLLSKRYEQVAA